MTGRDLVAFELAAWRRHPPLLSALLVAGAACALAFGAPDLAPFLGAALVALAGPGSPRRRARRG